MEAIFHDDYDPKADHALSFVEDGDESGNYIMTFVAAMELVDGRVVVFVNGTTSDEEGNDLSAHATPGQLCVYALRRSGGKWEVKETHEKVAAMGSNGQFGSIKWIELGKNKQGFIAFSGGVWQGNVITAVDIFELDDGVRHLGGFKQYSDNSGACAPGKDDCWEVEGNISLTESAPESQYRDIVVDFRDKRLFTTEDKDGTYVEHIKSDVHKSARYRFDGKKYVLASGSNPVPDI